MTHCTPAIEVLEMTKIAAMHGVLFGAILGAGLLSTMEIYIRWLSKKLNVKLEDTQ